MPQHPARLRGPARLARALVVASLAVLGAVPLAADPRPAMPARTPEHEAEIRRIKQIARDQLQEGARRKARAWLEWRRSARDAKRRGLAIAPFRAKKAFGDPDAPGEPAGPRAAAPLAAAAAQAIPTNVRANDSAGDAAGAGQAESMIGAWGDYVLVAWNDGQGFVSGPDVQGYAYSTDGGQTFTDGGVPPKLAGWVWTSDPVVAVNEKTGEFWYCGLVNPSGSSNGVASVRATFSGNAIQWSTPVLIASQLNSVGFIDKQWMVADSLTGNLYLTYTLFAGTSNRINFHRSTDGDGAVWGTAVQVSSTSDNGAVQGSRPAVGPNGEVYVTWSALGSGVLDFFRFRRSTNFGASFASQVDAASYIANFGTGAPGFNRERGLTFPSIAVDRTTGPHRGRIYVVWNECYDHYENFVNGPSHVEVEPNATTAQANPFTVGNKIRGTISSTSELDYFSTTLNAGQHLVLWADSLSSSLLYTLRVFAPGGVQRLAYAGDLSSPGGGSSYYTFTAPATGTYYVRVAGAGGTGSYMVRTAFGVVDDPSRATDSRDVFLARSDDGVTWAAPVRVSDAPVGFHEWLPEVAVGADGHPYVTWFDWRDDTHGSRSHQHVSRSLDGGVSWESSRRFTSVQNNWTSIGSNIAPNQGDYSHLTADARWVRPTWADGRNGDADVWVTRIDTWHLLEACARDSAANPGEDVALTWTVRNGNPLFANDLPYTVTDARGWLTGAGGTLAVGADATAALVHAVSVPDSAAPGVNRVCASIENRSGTRTLECCADLTVNAGSVTVGGGALAFALAQNVPSPATGPTRIDFTLPRAGAVTLAIYGLRGERIRTLVAGERGAGPHSVVWDGRDARGRIVEPGAYFYRLEGLGHAATRRLVWMP